MNSPVPTFSLPACPRCSSVGGGLNQPLWKFAHRTSEKRRRNCYFWVAWCKHAEGFSDANRIYDEPEEWAKIEAAWRVRAEQLFVEVTAGWTLTQRERWRAMLDSRHWVEGTTPELGFAK